MQFFIAAILLALAASGWWLQRIAFDTSVSGELAEVVLEQPEIRDEIAELTAEAAADAASTPSTHRSVRCGRRSTRWRARAPGPR